MKQKFSTQRNQKKQGDGCRKLCRGPPQTRSRTENRREGSRDPTVPTGGGGRTQGRGRPSWEPQDDPRGGERGGGAGGEGTLSGLFIKLVTSDNNGMRFKPSIRQGKSENFQPTR